MAQETLITPPIRQSLEDTKSAQANGIAQPLTEKSWYLFFDRLAQMANRQRWIITYGFHANRPDPAVMPDGALYVEWDRPYVVYQAQGGTWHYVGGTMFGTLSPDQRPTDLGANDAGFDFRGTDQQREFIWSQTAWVEVTPVGGANTLTTVGSIPEVTAPGVLGPSIMTQSSGQIGIGTTAPEATLQVLGPSVDPTLDKGIVLISGGDLAHQVRIGYNASADYGWIQSVHDGVIQTPLVLNGGGGSVGVGMLSPTYLLQLGQDSAAKPGTNTWTVASDSRLKRNVESFTQGLETLVGLRPVRYEYNGEAGTPEGLRGVGVIAQEAQAVYPACIRTTPGKIAGNDTEVLATNTSDLTWMMVNAFRDLDERIRKLEKAGLP